MTTTVNIKEIIKKHTKEQTEKAKNKANSFKKTQEEISKKWNEYYSELKKYSNNFKLIEKDENMKFGISVNSFNPDGTLNYSLRTVNVCDITVDYKSYEIIYDVELPDGKSKPKVIVENHVTHNRSGWSSTDHGLKMKLKMGWDDDKKYYKTGKKIFEKIQYYVASIIRQDESRRTKQKLREDSVKIMAEKYPQAKVYHCDRTQAVIVENPKNKIRLTYFLSNSKLEFSILDVTFEKTGSEDLDNLITKLGNI